MRRLGSPGCASQGCWTTGMVFLLGWERGQHVWVPEFVYLRFQPVGRKIFAFCIVSVLWEHLELGCMVTTAGLGFPQMLGVLPCAGWPQWHHWHPALGLGSAQLSGASCSAGSPYLGRWETPCHAGGCAGPLWWYLGLPPICLCHKAKPPPPCPSRAWGDPAALGDTVTSLRSTCT